MFRTFYILDILMGMWRTGFPCFYYLKDIVFQILFIFRHHSNMVSIFVSSTWLVLVSRCVPRADWRRLCDFSFSNRPPGQPLQNELTVYYPGLLNCMNIVLSRSAIVGLGTMKLMSPCLLSRLCTRKLPNNPRWQPSTRRLSSTMEQSHNKSMRYVVTCRV